MKYWFFFIFIILNACSSLPPKIADAPREDVDYSQASANSEQLKGVPIRWGGTIIEVRNEEEYSEIHVIYYPLNIYGRPKLRKQNGGRFLMQSKKFLDPAIYVEGAEITIAGTLNGEIERIIGNKTIKLPLITSSGSFLWPNFKSVPFPYYNRFGPYPYYGLSPYLGSYYRPRYYNRCY